VYIEQSSGSSFNYPVFLTIESFDEDGCGKQETRTNFANMEVRVGVLAPTSMVHATRLTLCSVCRVHASCGLLGSL
jgi:hypothetical protein